MKFARQIALDPNREHASYLWRAAGTHRFAWNWALGRWEEDYQAFRIETDSEKKKKLMPSVSRYKAEWNEIRRTEFPWSLDVTKCAGTQAIIDLGASYDRAIKECVAAKREGRTRRRMFGFPKRKKKFLSTPSFALWNDQISFPIVNGRQYVKLPHVGLVRMRETLPGMGGILGARISHRRGKWVIAVQFDTEWNDGETSDKAAQIATGKARKEAKARGASKEEIQAIKVTAERSSRLVPIHPRFDLVGGSDVGVRSVATRRVSGPDGFVETVSTGPSKAIKRSQKKLRLATKKFNKGLQRKRKKVQKVTHSGKIKTVYEPWKKGEKIELSNRDKRRRVSVQKVQWTITNQREDFLHKDSTMAARSCGVLVGEDINVFGMVKGSSNPRLLLDSSMSRYLGMVEYKAEREGGLFVRAPRFFPSSKRCSTCSHVHAEIKRGDYEWDCPACSTRHDRDGNAATNLEYLAKLIVLEDETSVYQLASSIDPTGSIGLARWLMDAREKYQTLKALRLENTHVGGATAESFETARSDEPALAAILSDQGETGSEKPEREGSVHQGRSNVSTYGDI